MNRTLLAILASAIWINASEFFRNEWLLKPVWQAHYAGLGLTFPAAPVNGIVWMIWGIAFAILIHAVSRRFSLLATFGLAWFAGFVLMWLVTWNLAVLPVGILALAIPLSLLEAFGAALICQRINPVPAPARTA